MKALVVLLLLGVIVIDIEFENDLGVCKALVGQGLNLYLVGIRDITAELNRVSVASVPVNI